MSVADPCRAGGKNMRGEWIGVRQVRQIAFGDSDSTLTVGTAATVVRSLMAVDGSLARLRLSGLRAPRRLLWLAHDERAPL